MLLCVYLIIVEYRQVDIQRSLKFNSKKTARPQTQHEYHHDTKPKPEAATAVIELLMMGRRTPETC
jgi:hypothetical protein